MKTPSSFRAVATAAFLASLFAAAPAEARRNHGRPGSGTVARDAVKTRAAEEFKELRDYIEEEKKEDPLKSVYLSQIAATQARFDARADAVLKQETYHNWEFEFLRGQVREVIIPTIKAAVEASESLPLAERESQFTARAEDSGKRAERFNRDFVQQNGEAILASIPVETPPNPAGENSVSEEAGVQPGNGFVGGVGVGLTTNFRRRSPEEILSRSEVARLAVEAAKYAVNPTEPTDPNPGGGAGTNPGGGAGTNPGGGAGTNPGSGAGTNPGSGAGTGPVGPGGSQPGGSRPSGGFGGDLVQAITSPSGVAQLYATNGVQALRGRDYASAYDMARRALELNPNNRTAAEVYHASKGRVDGAQAGATAWGAAKGGASAFGGGPGDPGAFGAASAAPGVAAMAAAGAARVATDQARASAMSAMRLGDAQSAIDILTKALDQNPANPILLNLRAQAYGRVGRWADALRDAESGVALVPPGAPANIPLLTTLALAQNRNRRWRDALATSERMIAADPRGAWGYANRAHARAGMGDRDGLLADIGMAARLDPRFQKAAADAALLQLPSDSDVMFLFPNESGGGAAPAPAAAGRARSFGVVAGAGIVGGLLLALGLLSTVLAPLKDTVVSVFTKAKRTGPAAAPAVATAQPASVAGHAGALIRGQYEISRQIGQGGMGTVYEGTDRSLGRRVAIKKMRDELRLNARERDRFIIEAKTVASLHHPNIVDIYAIAEEGDDVYLVFEYVDGKTVHDLVQLRGRLDPAESVRAARAMGEALTYAHSRGVIHRDMKPSNVMVTADGRIKVMDFGIARMAKDALTRYSMTNTVVGTPPYMAPEQEQGVVRKESDVYSLAVCAYEMLTGKMPFIGIGAGMLMNKINMSYIPPSRAIAGLPEALDEVFQKAFQADPDRRFRTPLEFTAALETAAGGARSKPA